MAEVEVFGCVLVELIELDVDVAVVVLDLFGESGGDGDVVADLIEASNLFLIDFEFMAFGMGKVFEVADMLEFANLLIFIKLGVSESGCFLNLFGQLIILDEIPEIGVDHFEKLTVGF